MGKNAALICIAFLSVLCGKGLSSCLTKVIWHVWQCFDVIVVSNPFSINSTNASFHQGAL